MRLLDWWCIVIVETTLSGGTEEKLKEMRWMVDRVGWFRAETDKVMRQ